MERARVSSVNDYFAEPHLIKWFRKNGFVECDQIAKEAAEVGTAIDSHIQNDIWGEERVKIECSKKLEQKYLNCVAGWERFKLENPDKFEMIREHRVNMQREIVMGDLVGHPDWFSPTKLLDFKNASSEKWSLQVKKGYRIQTSMYTKMLNNGYGTTITTNGVVVLDRHDPGNYLYSEWGEAEIEFWQRKFMARYEAYREDEEFKEIERKKLSKEVLG
jgi:hypothetical protein